MFDTQPLPGSDGAARWSELEPGALLTALLTSRPVDELSDDEALEDAAAWHRLISHAQARQLRVLGRFSTLRPEDEFADDEVAAELRLSRVAATVRLNLAEQLCTRLPAVLDALQHGRIDLPKARVIAERTAALSDAHAAAVTERVLPKADTQTVGQLRASVDRAVLAVDPEGAQQRHEAAKRDRRVELGPDRDGMGWLSALMGADDATACYSRVDTLAREAGADDERGMDARRADVMRDLILGRHRGGDGVEVSLGVTLDAKTLAGLADHPGHLNGHGPIPPGMARDLAAAARRWRAMLVDEQTGQLRDLSTAYRPTRLLQEFIRARDLTCRFPGCRQPAQRCDLDHTSAHRDGGPTARCNLGPFCRRHHRLKHESDWVVVQPQTSGSR